MKDLVAITMLGALAQEHRIRMFRLLVKTGSSGMPSSEIADHAGISTTSASFHLKELEHAGLITATRQGRFILSFFPARSGSPMACSHTGGGTTG